MQAHPHQINQLELLVQILVVDTLPEAAEEEVEILVVLVELVVLVVAETQH